MGSGGSEAVGDALRRAEETLAATGCETPRGDAQWIAAVAIGDTRSAVLAHPERSLESAQLRYFDEMVMRRSQREPLGYVLGTVVFRGLELEVGPGCFVPRPETEMTAERAIVRARALARGATVVDAGTACG